MNVKIGENCQTQIQRVRYPDFGYLNEAFKRVRVEFVCGLTLIVFLLTKAVEIHLASAQAWQGALLLQVLGYCFLMLFAVLLYKSTLGKPLEEEALLRSLDNQEFHDSEKVPGSLESFPLESPVSPLPPLMQTMPLGAAELIREIKYPIENIMAYTRFYQTTTERESQHWKDVVEIMEQAIRIQEVVNRVEAMAPRKEFEPLEERGNQSRDLFRRTARNMELLPLVVRGSDPLGEFFETPSYTLNTSCRGACLLLPGKVVGVGQEIYIQNHQMATEASVRWVLPGEAGDMVFAGVEFTRPTPRAAQADSAFCRDSGPVSLTEGTHAFSKP